MLMALGHQHPIGQHFSISACQLFVAVVAGDSA